MFLNCHTGFSFKYGTLPPRALFAEAKRCDVHKLAVTEINNTASYMELLRICGDNARCDNGLNRYGKAAYALEIAVGIEFRRQNELLYIAIARNNRGFEKINRFLSYHNREATALPFRAPLLEDSFVIYPFGKVDAESLLPDEYIGIRPHELSRFSRTRDGQAYPGKFVALWPVTFLPPGGAGKTAHTDFNVHRLLRAIANNVLLSRLSRHQQAQKNEFMVGETEVEKTFSSFPGLVRNARQLLAQCYIDLPLGTDRNRKTFTGSRESDRTLLEAETLNGFRKVYGSENKKVWKRIEKELDIIAKKNFTSYYLIVYDLTRFAREMKFDFVGRGSGANSTVAYCLGITNVDPVELDLYFERFLNEERTSPPDFDIDFSWDQRDAIYDYIFSRYGPDHVCLLGTHVTYQARSIHRELGKVFGLPREEIDALADDSEGNRNRDHIRRLVSRYASRIMQKELPSGLSIHAGGMLITEAPIYAYTATEMPPKGYPVSHFEMHNAEDFGIHKFDVLSQRGLGHIRETIRLVKRNRNIDVDISRFGDFKDDENVRRLLRSGKAMGCFYVESPAMRMLLGKLRCDDHRTLIAASSIIRPGVAKSGMMRAYIERFHAQRNGIAYDSIHPRINELMRETYGVMVYQEDVLKVAHEFAGLTLTEADVLRRAMSGKYRSREEFQRIKERFYDECQKRNYDQHVIDRVWFEIECFSGYSFAKGHSASYVVESYQSLFLKTYFPLEFMVGVINNFGGFYRTEFYFHEARMNGATIEPPCVNNSGYLTALRGKDIYAGFAHIKGLNAQLGKEIEDQRGKSGAYTGLADFIDRIHPGLEQLRLLIRVGALRFSAKSKQHLLWDAMLHFSSTRFRVRSSDLFDSIPGEFPLPPLSRGDNEDAFDELELLGFPLGDPFKLLAAIDHGEIRAASLFQNVGKHIHITGYLVTTKDSMTRNRQTMHFGTFLDADGEVFDTIHFPEPAKKFPFRGRGFYRIHGTVVEDFGVCMIGVSYMEKLPMIHKRAEESLREPAVNAHRSHGGETLLSRRSGHGFLTGKMTS